MRTVRVLHVLNTGLCRGGVETWLLNVLRHIDREQFRMDFLVPTDQPCEYDEEVAALGSAILRYPETSKMWTYPSVLRKAHRAHGPYDILHCHHRFLTGYVLWAARRAGFRIRIAHSHTSSPIGWPADGLVKRLQMRLLRRWIPWNVTLGLAVSEEAAACLYGRNWRSDARFRVLHTGFDLSPFRQSAPPGEVRAELGLPADAFVLGHVGRFALEKNHEFLLETAQHVAAGDPRMRLLLIGWGELEDVVRAKAARAGLSDRIVFAGARGDVPRLLLGAMDVFVFPSIHEGLGMALVEAQAAGLPCVFSDTVPRDAEIVGPLLRRMSLKQPALAWAEAILALRRTPRALNRAEALEAVERTDFNISRCVESLTAAYLEQLERLPGWSDTSQKRSADATMPRRTAR